MKMIAAIILTALFSSSTLVNGDFTLYGMPEQHAAHKEEIKYSVERVFQELKSDSFNDPVNTYYRLKRGSPNLKLENLDKVMEAINHCEYNILKGDYFRGAIIDDDKKIYMAGGFLFSNCEDIEKLRNRMIMVQLDDNFEPLNFIIDDNLTFAPPPAPSIQR